MGKLGGKARKFAKKNLQSVHKRNRKTYALFSKKRTCTTSSSSAAASSKDQNAAEENMNSTVPSNISDCQGDKIENISLDEMFTEDDSDVADDASDSDGYLSEDLTLLVNIKSQNDIDSEDSSNFIGLSVHNNTIQEELTLQKNKLDTLKKKEPEFTKFLASYGQDFETFQDELMDSDDDVESNHPMKLHNEGISNVNQIKVLKKSFINAWCQLAKEEYNESAITCLLNSYRAACHYGAESNGVSDSSVTSHKKIKNGDIFSSILMFMLREADNIFRSVLKIPSSSFKKEAILELRDSSKWKTMKAPIKSYLRSTLFLLNQITDSEILAFALGRLRASLIFFSAFPFLLRRLIKVSIHLWVSSEGILASSSFLVIRDVAVVFSTECFDICFKRSYRAYVTHSKVYLKHTHFLRNSLVDLCSLDVHRTCAKAILSIEQLTFILKQGFHAKKKEALKKICSWQYVNCIDLWVMFVSANMRDHDLHQVFYVIVQLINGVACLFPGPKYFPLRLKCIQWLNNLSSASGIFVPVASLLLDVLEYKIGKQGVKSGTDINHRSVLKVPKHWLKSRNFQEDCLLSAVEHLCSHFAQWGYWISFPELATIPLIRVKKFYESVNTESFKQVLKRLIDQVEQNVEFVQKKRDEAAFSPKDHSAVESFLQFEKCSSSAPFTQYYRSVMQKAASRILDAGGKQSFLEPRERKRKRRKL